MAHSPIFGGKCFCIITGGGKGIGRAIGVAISKKLSPDSLIVLTGRAAGDLCETRLQIEAVAPGVRVKSVPADLSEDSDQAKIEDIFSELTKLEGPTLHDFQHCILINNAGSLWDVTRFLQKVDVSDVKSLQQYCMLNLTSPLLLTSHFLRSFPKRDGFRRSVVNISSLAAVEPMKSCGVYCMGKAARDMLFKTFASEEPDVRVLNYAPGPVDTAMNKTLRETSADSELRDMFSKSVASNQILKPDQTASKLVTIMEEDTYESGAHVDYFDVPDTE